MIRDQEPLAVLIGIVIAIVVLGGLAVFAVSSSLQTIQGEISSSGATPVDVSGWQTYENDQYGFEFDYPSQWQISTTGLLGATPFVVLGDPLSGKATYDIQVFIEPNPGSLSSGEYVHDLLAEDRAQDAQNAKGSSTPQMTPSFSKSYVLTLGGYPAYELYNVFESDHNAEQIYVAHGNEILRFDFPVAEENPNIYLPVANNAVAHNIANTLVFTN